MSKPMDTARQSGYRRLLIGFNHQVECRSALDLAAKLAEAAQAELAGVFVVDQDLLDMARLPFTTEILRASGQIRNLDPAAIERELRAVAEVMQKDLQILAARAQRQCSFRTVRGHLLRTLIEQAEAGDLVLLRSADLPWTGAKPELFAIEGPVVLMTPPGASGDGLSGLARLISQALKQPFIAEPMGESISRLRDLKPGLIIAPASMFGKKPEEDAIKRFAEAVRCPVLMAPL